MTERRITVGDVVTIERDETRWPSKGTWPQFRGHTGTVVEVNLGEYGVIFGKVWPRTDRPGVLRYGGTVTWFQPYEIRRVTDGRSAEVAQEPSPVSQPSEDPPARSNRAPDSTARPSNAIGCGRCGGCWTGFNACHCAASGCHRSFTSVSAFDRHRRGGKCLDPASAGLVPANKPWPGWSLPGTWTGPDDDNGGDRHG